MNYNYTLIKSTNYTPTYWSGGMATELTTYPEGSSFAKRDFLWRLGFAKIDIDTSTFSSLPGIKRHLMVTDGSMILTHKNRYSKKLLPFSQDYFMGDWNTTTDGKCSVFNLMTRENYDGILSHIEIQPDSNYTFEYEMSSKTNSELIALCLHPISSSIDINLNNELITVNCGDLLIINYNKCTFNTSLIINNSSNDKAIIISSLITKNE